jgi:ankyrin repeat protein
MMNNDANVIERAAAGGHRDLVEYLLDRGANIEVKDEGDGPLIAACSTEGRILRHRTGLATQPSQQLLPVVMGRWSCAC